MKKSRFSILILMVIITLVSCGKSYDEPVSEKTLVVCLGNNPLHFNVNLEDCLGHYPAFNIMNSLIGRDDRNNYVADLAESWSISKDGKTYTFYLTKDIKWHDDEPFTSSDVKWTFDIIIKEKGLMVDRLKTINNIECPNDDTVIFNLKEPDASLLSVIPSVKILPKHIYNGTDWRTNEANLKPIGTGPFKFVEYKRNVSVTLEANEDYFRGRPKIDKLIFSIIPDENTAIQAFINKEVDILDYSSAVMPSAVKELERIRDVKVTKAPSTSRQYIAFNMKKYPFNQLKLRQAVALTVDRDEIVAKAHKGYGWKAQGFYTPTIAWAYNEDSLLPDRNIEKAKRLLDNFGYYPDEKGVRVKNLEIVTFQFPTFVDIAKIVQANLKEIGIDAKITVLEYSAWYRKVRKGDFDIAILGGDHGSDPERLSERVGSNGFMNIMGYSNKEIDELLVKGKQTFKQYERASIYKKVQTLISQDMPIVPLSEWMYIVVTRNSLSGHPINDGLGRVPTARYSLIEIN